MRRALRPGAAMTDLRREPPRRLRVATTSLAGCFGCHMSLLDT